MISLGVEGGREKMLSQVLNGGYESENGGRRRQSFAEIRGVGGSACIGTDDSSLGGACGTKLQRAIGNFPQAPKSHRLPGTKVHEKCSISWSAMRWEIFLDAGECPSLKRMFFQQILEVAKS